MGGSFSPLLPARYPTFSGWIVARTAKVVRLAVARRSKSFTNARQVALASCSDKRLISTGSPVLPEPSSDCTRKEKDF